MKGDGSNEDYDTQQYVAEDVPGVTAVLTLDVVHFVSPLARVGLLFVSMSVMTAFLRGGCHEDGKPFF